LAHTLVVPIAVPSSSSSSSSSSSTTTTTTTTTQPLNELTVLKPISLTGIRGYSELKKSEQALQMEVHKKELELEAAVRHAAELEKKFQYELSLKETQILSLENKLNSEVHLWQGDFLIFSSTRNNGLSLLRECFVFINRFCVQKNIPS
jgi:hypothetical protein